MRTSDASQRAFGSSLLGIDSVRPAKQPQALRGASWCHWIFESMRCHGSTRSWSYLSRSTDL